MLDLQLNIIRIKIKSMQLHKFFFLSLEGAVGSKKRKL